MAAEEIIELLENVPTSNWEDTALNIVDVLARSNISYPQPFIAREVIACGNTFRSDRLYADGKGLLVNVLLDDEHCESLGIEYSTIQDVDIGQAARHMVQVTMLLSQPPRLGKDHIYPRSADTTCPALRVTFALPDDRIDRLKRALKSRGLGPRCPILDILATESEPRSSLAVEPANLELDSNGRLVQELSQTERIENVSQFYQTNEASDSITSPEDSQDFGDIVIAPSPVQARSSPPQSGALSRVPATAEPPAPGRLDSLGDVQQPPGPCAEKPLLPKAIDVSSLSRSGSHSIRAAAFGLSDEELSEISDYESSPPRSKVLRRSSTTTSLVRGRIPFEPILATSTGTSSSATRVARGGIGNVVLDSDDDYPPAAPVSPARRRTKQKALIRGSTVDESQPPFAGVLAVAGPPAHIPTTAVPLTPSPLPGDVTLVPSTGPEKVLRFSDIPAPDFNAALSSPLVAPKSVLKSAIARKTAQSQLATSALPPSSPAIASGTTPVNECKNSALKASDILNDLVPPSSSPTPGAKKTVRAKLRKREDNTEKATISTSTKRKALETDDVENSDPAILPAGRPAKRTRGHAELPAPATNVSGGMDTEPHTGNARELPELHAARARSKAAPRPMKKYRVKKGRASSPILSPLKEVPSVDYDALPSPPRPHAAAKSSSPAHQTNQRTKPKPRPKRKVAPKGEVSKKPAAEAPMAKAREDAGVRDKHSAVAKTAAGAVRARPIRARAVKNAAPVDDGTCAQGGAVAVSVVDQPLSAPSATNPEPPRPQPGNNDAVAALDNSTDALRDASEFAVVVDIQTESETHTVKPPRDEVVLMNPSAALPSKRHRAGGSERGDLNATSDKSNVTPWDTAFEHAQGGHRDEVAPDACPSSLVSLVPEPMEVDEVGVSPPRHCSAESNGTSLPSVAEVSVPRVAGSGLAHGRPDAIIETKAEAAALCGILKPAPQSHIASGGRKGRHTGAVPEPGLDASPIVIKKEAETIDLTLDSPPAIVKRTLPRARGRDLEARTTLVHTSATLESGGMEPGNRTVAASTDCNDGADVLSYLRKVKGHDIRLLTPQKENGVFCPLPRVTRERDAQDNAYDERGPSSNAAADSSVGRIIDVLNQFHEVIIHNVENKFAGVRHHARLGRNKLLRNAIEDLISLRTDSVNQFNKLVDLEAEYATSGRGLIHNSEDWMKTNIELDRHLTRALEQHDRTMLSKKMPLSLVALTL
ncbi:hypothetical protein C8Q77DRAFT_1153270 [Trametes polyzona]|nr:hypothetical protein C8Q77DRAFT_1153270 [Trametes polyzona]